MAYAEEQQHGLLAACPYLYFFGSFISASLFLSLSELLQEVNNAADEANNNHFFIAEVLNNYDMAK